MCSPRRRRSGPARSPERGFTLLEVLIAISILGLGLTAILSAQTGLFASAQRAERLSIAAGLLRCRMAQVETELMKNGYPIGDQNDSGSCCDDVDMDDRTFTCDWKIEGVKLPPAPASGDLAGGADLGAGQSSLGPLGALAAVEQSKGAALGDGADVHGLANLMGGQGAASAQTMAPLVMSLVYPDLKPMLEASIRKVTVRVLWHEGRIERDLSATLFMTNPQQGGLDQQFPAGMQNAIDSIVGGASPTGGAAPLGGSK